MKAALVTRYGSPDVIAVAEVPKPVPAPGEILIRVHAATVNRTDCGELRAHPFFIRLFYGLRRPNRTILGMDFAGVVEDVGTGVTSFRRGDRVFGMCPSRRNGAQAEYVCIPASAPVATVPDAIDFAEAVIWEGAYYANASLTRLGVTASHRLLVYGASGAIGSAAVQLAKHYGADVTAVVLPRHLELARTLGADRVVDRSSQDYKQLERSFDSVFDAVGKMTIFDWRRLLKPGGVFATTDIGPWGQNLLFWAWSSATRSGRVVIPLPRRDTAAAFARLLRKCLAAGQIRAVIDRRYSLDAIADAYRYVETGEKAGIVVIDVAR